MALARGHGRRGCCCCCCCCCLFSPCMLPAARAACQVGLPCALPWGCWLLAPATCGSGGPVLHHPAGADAILLRRFQQLAKAMRVCLVPLPAFLCTATVAGYPRLLGLYTAVAMPVLLHFTSAKLATRALVPRGTKRQAKPLQQGPPLACTAHNGFPPRLRPHSQSCPHPPSLRLPRLQCHCCSGTPAPRLPGLHCALRPRHVLAGLARLHAG